jgi:predicted amidohydrolase
MKLLLSALLVSSALAGDPSLTVAGLCVTPARWDKRANLAKLEHYAKQAAARGAQLALTPEGFLEGYVGNDKVNPDLTRANYFAAGESIDGLMLQQVRRLARELKIYLGVGFAERRADRMYNSFVVYSPEGSIALRYSKMHNADDEPYNTTGTEFEVASTPYGRWGALICYDRRMPETSRILAIKGAQIILVPAWGAYDEMNDALMRTRAFENSVWVAFVHPKRGLIIDPRGAIIARDNGPGDQIVMGTIHPKTGIGEGPIRGRKPELYQEILAPKIPERPQTSER